MSQCRVTCGLSAIRKLAWIRNEKSAFGSLNFRFARDSGPIRRTE